MECRSTQAKILAIQLAGKESQEHALREQAAAAAEKSETAHALVRELELALATARANMASQQEVVTELRAHLATRKQKAEGVALAAPVTSNQK